MEREESEILTKLSNYRGSENFYQHMVSFATYTDGAKKFAELCGAFWLIDIAVSYIPRAIEEKQHFFVVRLEVVKPEMKGLVSIIGTNSLTGEDKVIAEQELEYTDFPLDRFELYVADNGKFWTVLLPSEY